MNQEKIDVCRIFHQREEDDDTEEEQMEDDEGFAGEPATPDDSATEMNI